MNVTTGGHSVQPAASAAQRRAAHVMPAAADSRDSSARLTGMAVLHRSLSSRNC